MIPYKTMDRDRKKISIWLCDLTYTQQTLASDVMPNAVGSIAAYSLKMLKDQVSFEIIKRPEELAQWLKTKPRPQVIGFSNYVWNNRLTMSFARAIKKNFPEIVLITGGPNYAHTLEGRANYFKTYPFIDFHVINEGEQAFYLLIQQLLGVDMDKAQLHECMPSIDFVNGAGEFRAAAEFLSRIKDLSEIPSPYTLGLLDRYFDGKWAPIIQTNRGCPFTCTFCVEGNAYYNKVNQSQHDKVREELEYIAPRMMHLKESGGRNDLQIADSNFGMFKEDIHTCHIIAEMQDKYGWPEYINVATGKNNKHRVLEAAKLIRGALKLSGSVQSLDKEVLGNIKRSNISETQLIELALEARDAGANVYSEVILGLPGDKPQSHFETIQKLMNADFNIICLYQLMLLPGTELISEESRKKWGFQTAFRVMPRCYGSYEFMDRKLSVAENEEIVIANDAMSFDQYLNARRFHLVINVFYNDGVFKDIFGFLKFLGIRKYDWLMRIHQSNHDGLNTLMKDFLDESSNELWKDRTSLQEFTSDENRINEYLSGDRGSNLIFKYKSISITKYVNALQEAAVSALGGLISELDGVEAHHDTVGKEILRYDSRKMTQIFDCEVPVISDTFSYDIERLVDEEGYVHCEDYKFAQPRKIQFFKTPEQDELIQRYVNVYGNDTVGLSRILAKVYVGGLLRKPRITPVSQEEEKAMRFGQTKLSGLNPFV
jgi:radical SAM superfamily enzyme YgiQ (UPF0313 family)